MLSLLTAGLIGFAGCQSNGSSGKPGSEGPENYAGDGTFRVEGTKIIDPEGNVFDIRGVNVNGPGWCFPRDTLQDVDLIVDVWQFNAVRLCMATKWDSWAANYNKDLDPIVKAFTDKGIVVIMELHDYTGLYPPLTGSGYAISEWEYIRPYKDFEKWWVDKAKRFKDNPYVWFNIMNEPGNDNSKESADSWLKIHSDIIKAIRKNGANNIIFLDDHGFGQASGYYGGASSYDSAVIRMGPEINKKYKNIAYSLHVYDAWRDGIDRFSAYFADAKERNLCVIIGEFGAGTKNPAHYNAIKNMYNSAIEFNIGRMYWAWDDGGLPLTNDGCGWAIDRTDGEKPGNLNWPGEQVWLDNRGELTAPVSNYVLEDILFSKIDFEDGTPGGWGNWGGSSIQNGISYNGSKALVVAAGAAGGGGFAMELQANTTYRISAWGRNNSPTSPPSDVGVKYRLSTTAPTESHFGLSFNGSTWEQKTRTFTTPSEFYGTTFYVWKNSPSAIFYLDDIELVKAE